MVRNIVFDLGNVLISFRPADYLEKNKCPAELQQTILTDIFRSSEWLMLDNGNIDPEEAIELISRKSSLRREEIARIFSKRTSIMFPLEDNVRMLPELKKQGFRLYYISNFPLDIFDEVKNSYDFFKYFNGGIISAEVKCSKPDVRIFRIFLEKYNLVPDECLYIDDIEINVQAAESQEMKGFITSGSMNISGELFKILNRV